MVFNLFLRRFSQAAKFPIFKTVMLPDGTFTGKTVFITGGATGLGKAMSSTLLKLGANVFICSRKEENLLASVEELKKMTGKTNISYAVVDVRDSEQVTAGVDKCENVYGLPSLVVNNAAGNFISPTERLSPNAFRTVQDIVLNGTAFVTLDVGKRLINAGKEGTFLSITTTYAQSGSGFVSPSAAAKAGVEAFMKSIASEWGRYGIRANCLAPGPIETKGAFSRLDPTGEFSEKMLAKIPVGRTGAPEELANLASYLLSDYSSWISGSVFTMDGGEYVSCAGEFNDLRVVTPEQWDYIESLVRKVNKV